jgi:hypothetical protein
MISGTSSPGTSKISSVDVSASLILSVASMLVTVRVLKNVLLKKVILKRKRRIYSISLSHTKVHYFNRS